MPNGSWSLKEYPSRCQDKACSGPGQVESHSAATAMELCRSWPLAGRISAGPYQKVANSSIYWLVKNQKKDGDLFAGAEQPMYSHGLAAIALCEDYGMSHDKSVARRPNLQSISFSRPKTRRPAAGVIIPAKRATRP